MAYIDYLKADYSDKPKRLREEYIKRDKENLAQLIQERVARDIDNIIERWYEIDDVGLITVQEKFLDLLEEAEQLYSFGYYTGAVAVSGIASEEYAKYLFQKNIGGVDNNTQEKRINRLATQKVIDGTLRDKFHDIRRLRNECMHYDQSFKSLSDEDLKLKAQNILSLYKEVLSSIADKHISNEKAIISVEHYDSEREFTLKYRNILMKNGVNLQLPPGVKNQVKQSLYLILEIDIETEMFKEMTLFDILNGGLSVVDLTIPQTEMISEAAIKEGNIMAATLISAVNGAGLTADWNLICIDEVCRCNLGVDDLAKLV
ncbi:hypothetical protein [Oribacterium sp. WCC10]|uniref:hypothetical protein n=1 Tax=Oribacterium sp. WCC10 TaxID=1855343 RepID=UPI0008E11279|nr:hypothetical protein [Oribacterium sp. WCC10]SFG27604.1 hypothetical protein SAMN05216356_104208 [Oribacterium sp. WCC10]